MNETTTKHCRKCDQAKPLEDYHRSSRNRDGRQTYCRECQCSARKTNYWQDPAKQAEYAREYREANRGADLERKRAYDHEHPTELRLRNGKGRASRQGLPYEHITVQELHADLKRRGLSPDHDAYTGQPLEDGWHIDHVTPMSYPNTPGHVVSNLVLCNARTNISKSNRTLIDYLADREVAATNKEISA